MIRRNSGHIVSIASLAGHIGTAGLSDYTASKFGAVGFNESLRAELKLKGYSSLKFYFFKLIRYQNYLYMSIFYRHRYVRRSLRKCFSSKLFI